MISFCVYLGFHEAIGDTMALAVNTPAHLKTLGLLPDTKSNDKEKENIAYLFHVALQKVFGSKPRNSQTQFNLTDFYSIFSLFSFHLLTPW